MFGFAIFVAYLIDKVSAYQRSLAIVLSLFIVLSLGTMTFLRNRVWRDGLTLWSDVISKSPLNPRAHNSLGSVLAEQGSLEEAALRINPDYAEAHNNLGSALARQGKRKDAMEHFLTALNLKPEYADAHHNLGVALREEGRLEEAVKHFSGALKIKPDYADANKNLELALRLLGESTESSKPIENP